MRKCMECDGPFGVQCFGLVSSADFCDAMDDKMSFMEVKEICFLCANWQISYMYGDEMAEYFRQKHHDHLVRKYEQGRRS